MKHGAKVVLGNLDDKQFADALKIFPANDPRVPTVVHDVMERDGWERKADEIEKKFGPRAHPGEQRRRRPAGSRPAPARYKDWEWGMGVNFWGPVYGVHTFVPRMLRQQAGLAHRHHHLHQRHPAGQRRRHLHGVEDRGGGPDGRAAP